MKFAVVPLVALSAVSVVAADHINRNARHANYLDRRDKVLGRQAVAAPSAGSSSANVIASSTSVVPAPAGTGTASTPALSASAPAVTTPTVAGTIIPPLDQITSGAPIETPLSMFTTFTAGATPTWVSGAPPLPTIAIVGANYPTLDQVPQTNSPQVQQWLSELDLTGIPNLNLTIDGSCASDPAFAQDQTRCWWTCGGCTRPTDIVACPDKLDWGVSYDDGPSPYTPKLVSFLHDHDITATFFVVGSRVISRPDMLQTEYMLGHEISVHTWSHTPLTTLTNEQIVAELGWTRQAIKDVIGVSPRTMRPPYGDIDDRVRAVCHAMGLTPVIWTGTGDNEFDTDDWKIAGGTATGPSSFAAWEKIVATATNLTTGFITLQHDLYQQSVDMAVGYILPSALSNNPPFKLQSVIECLHQAQGQSYAELYVNTTSTNATTLGGTSSGSKPNDESASGKSGAMSTLGGVSSLSVVLGAGVAVLAWAW